MTTRPDRDREPAPGPARIVLRPIGTPLPLGFLGLLVATMGFSALQVHWVPATQGTAVALGVLAFTVPAQLLTSVYGYLARDPVAGTGMGVLAGTWGAVALVTLASPPGSTSPGLGVVLLAAAAAMLVPAVAATTKVVAAAVMALAAVRFAITGVAHLTGSGAWLTAAGVTGFVLAGVALSAALGFELEDARHRTILPLGRRGPGGDVMTGDLPDQLEQVTREAGVRSQL